MAPGYSGARQASGPRVDLDGARPPPRPRRCPSGTASPRTRSAPTAPYATRRASRTVAPSPVTARIRPPFVTSRSPCRAVPAWNTSAPADLGLLDARDLAAAIAVRRIVARREHDRHRGRRRDRKRVTGEIASRRRGEHGQEIRLEQRQQRLRLGIAEPAVELEHPRPVRGQHQAGVEQARRTARRAARARRGRVGAPVRRATRRRRRRRRARARRRPSRRCSGP